MGWAALVCALATLTLAYPALSGQFLVNPRSDQYIAGFAFRDFAVQALRAGGSIPQWNPYLYGGMPYVAAMHGDIFYPTQLLRLLMGTDAGMTWGFIIHTMLAGLFTYGFLRAWGLGFVPALVAGVAYLMSGPIASYASPGHDGKLFVSALLPLALWFLVRGMRDDRLWAWGGLALTVGLAILSPHPQLLQYLLLTSGAFALFLAFGADQHGRKMDRRTALTRLAFALGAVVVGLAIGGIQFAPVREYVAWSPRANGRDYAYATSYSFPLSELFNMYLPQFTGLLDKYYGRNGIHLHSEYIGGAVLLLASAAFGWSERVSFRRFWIATLVVSLLWMLGGSTPFFQLIYVIIPGTKFFRAPSTIIYVFALALSVLAALGTERVLARQVGIKLLGGWLAFGAVVALLASAGVLATMAKGIAVPMATMLAGQYGYPESAVPQIVDQLVSANASDIVVGSWRSFLFLGVAVGLLFAYLKGKLGVRALAFALPALIVVDLWSIERNYWGFLAPAKVLYATDPAIEFLKKEPQPGRVVVRALRDSGLAHPDPYFGTDQQGRGTGLMVHGIRSVTGYHGNELARYDELTQVRLPDNAPVTFAPTFWRHENVRYLYTNAPIPSPDLKLLVGPVKNSAGSTVYLYRVPGDNPYAWVASGLTKASDTEALSAVLDTRFDPLRLAVVSDTTTLKVSQPTSLPAPSTVTATTSGYRPGGASITLSAPASAGSALVVSENYFPGWKATVDGLPQDVVRADYNLIGVPLREGARKIELSFQDPAVSTGKGITFVALLIAVGALALGIVQDRRRSA